MASSRRDYGSGSIEQRTAGRWRITVESARDPVSGERRRHRFTVQGNKRSAQQALRQALTERDHGLDVRPNKVTVGQYLERWLSDYAAATVSDRTLAGYRQQCRRLSALIGSVRLQKLSPAQIQAAYANLGEELSNRTVLHHHRRLKQALKRAVIWGLIPVNPADAVTAPTPEHREMSVLSPEQIAELLASCREAAAGHGRLADGNDDARLYEVAVATGLRLGELLGLKWSDADFDRRRLTVQRAAKYVGGAVTLGPTKTAKSRRAIALSTSTCTVLRQQRAAQVERRLQLGEIYDDQGLVFPRVDGRIESPSNVSNRFRNLVRRLGFGVRFHDLRHTMATLAMAEGVPLKVVSERLGHANTQITADVYSHVLPDMQEDAADALERALARGRAQAAGGAS